jgi:hypothetical protein
MFTNPAYAQAQDNSDRLVDATMLPQEVPSFDVQSVNDMMDENTNPTAQHLTQMIDASAQAHRQQIMTMMQESTQAPTGQGATQAQPDYWFMNAASGQQAASQPGYATFDHNPIVAPGVQAAMAALAPAGPTTADEAALLQKIHAEKAHLPHIKNHLKVINPIGDEPPVAPLPVNISAPAPAAPQPLPAIIPPAPVTAQRNPAILELANNDDLNVATIARQASKASKGELSEDEVVISLH